MAAASSGSFEAWLSRCPPQSRLDIWSDGLKANRAQTWPERTTRGSNKATNTSSLSIVSIGMHGSLLKSLVSAVNPDDGAPHPGGKTCHPQ